MAVVSSVSVPSGRSVSCEVVIFLLGVIVVLMSAGTVTFIKSSECRNCDGVYSELSS